MSTVLTLKDIDFSIDANEALRYMGAAGTEDKAVLRLVENAVCDVSSVAKAAACYMRLPVNIKGEAIDFGFAEVKSHSLSLNLKDCDEVILFAATIGADFDRLLNRRLIVSPTEGLVLDAVGSAAIEGVCNSVNAGFAKTAKAELKTLKPRFSPGYGDLHISFQKELAQVLDTKRKIGMTLTDGMMMTPVKSVTAIIGVKSNDSN